MIIESVHRRMIFIRSIRPLLFTATLFFASGIHAAEIKPVSPPILIQIGKIDRNVKPSHATVTGPSGLKFKSATAWEEKPGSFIVYLKIDDFSPDRDDLVVQAGGKVFVPHSRGGDKDKFWSLELRDIDAVTAALFTGPLDAPPIGEFQVEWFSLRSNRVGEPVTVLLWISHSGDQEITAFYATDGGGNYPCRDMQFTFSATRNGNVVALNPKPLPNGFISRPFTFKSNSVLKSSKNLSEWLVFDQPGDYRVTAEYQLNIQNPKPNGIPKSWIVAYKNEFTVPVAPQALP